jgi:mono/diheme cytochrome c family protein
MKWIGATALAAVLMFSCSKTETTTSETSATSSEVTTTSTTDTSSTVVPADTMGTVVSTDTSASPSTMSTTDTSSTGATGMTGTTGMTGSTGSTSTTHTENLGTTPGPMMSSSTDLAADGLATFKAKGCVGCHGATGAADTAIGKKNSIRDFHSADVQKLSDDDLAKILKEGKGSVSKMAHKSKNLTDPQVKSLVAWIRTLK